MTLLTPLGLLGLISIIVLIIIYIIKPNYQQKMISSTFVWKLSLKYKKKKIPISKLRNILLIICQILILTACSLILTQPSQILRSEVEVPEVIAIIDSSASMRTEYDGETRFTRAINEVIKDTDAIFARNGIVTVILADENPSYLVQGIRAENKKQLENALEPLFDPYTGCAYGDSNMESAMVLCEEIVLKNPATEIYVYTDTQYDYVPEHIKVVDVCEESEWNAAILDAYAEYNEGYYAFYVDVACYGRDQELELYMEVENANAADSNDVGDTVKFTVPVYCDGDATKRVVFINEDLYEESADDDENVIYYRISEMDKIFSYQTVFITIDEDYILGDSLEEDNKFNLYSGQKEVLRIQYASAKTNPFFVSVLDSLRSVYQDRWDIQITELRPDTEAATEGFDLYIFEHTPPKVMPTDGVVFIVNPESAPSGSGFTVQGERSFNSLTLTEEDNEHPLMKNITADNITVSLIKNITYDASFKVLMTCGNLPALLVKEDMGERIVVMPFSLHYSNLAILKDFPLLMLNMFEHFFPITVSGSSFEVNEDITLNARGQELYVHFGQDSTMYNQFPSTLKVDMPGTYVLTQTTFAGKDVEESIYVKMPAKESDIWSEEESLDNPYTNLTQDDYFKDLLLYVAAALVALLFIEWALKGQESM